MSVDRKAIGANIANCRKKASMTQEELAEKVDLTVQQISYIENGRYGQSLNSLVKIANALGTTLDPFFITELENKREYTVSNLVQYFEQYDTDTLMEMSEKAIEIADLLSSLAKFKALDE